MSASTAETDHGSGTSPGLLGFALAGVLALWLGGFWYFSDGWWHRWALGWFVLPALLLNYRQVRVVVREERWLWVAGALLVWQILSRFWSSEPVEPMGSWRDAILVFGLLCGLLLMARGSAGPTWVFPALAIVTALVALFNLLVFYAHPERSFAESRLRNMLVYENGMNAVLSGLLFAFGGLIAAWKVAGTDPGKFRRRHWAWLAALVLSLLGLLATQSRGPMLMYAAGFLPLIFFERRRIAPAFIASALTVVTYFALLAWARDGQEAALDLIQRGSTGRFDIWVWFLQDMSGWDALFGKGMATSPTIPEAEFGWFIHHPHSVYVTQFYLTGLVGAALLLVLLAWAGQAGLKLALAGESLWLALLVGAAVALFFDGGHVLSLCSVGRLEILMLAVPAAMAVGRERAAPPKAPKGRQCKAQGK